MTRTACVKCPACSAPTAIAKLGPVELDLCTGCSGLWFDRAALRSLGGELSNEPLADDLKALLSALYKGSERTGKVYISCPACNEQLKRRTVANAQFLHCEAHGTWVDRAAAARLVRLMSGEGDVELRATGPLDAAARLRLVLDMFGFV